MKNKLLILVSIILLSTVSAFAGGQSEHAVTLPGTVVSVTNDANGTATIVLSTKGKTVSVTIPQRTAAKLDLRVGKRLTVKGAARDDKAKGSDGTDVKVEAVEQDGVEHAVETERDHSAADQKSRDSGDHKEGSSGGSHEKESHGGGSDD